MALNYDGTPNVIFYEKCFIGTIESDWGDFTLPSLDIYFATIIDNDLIDEYGGKLNATK